MAVPALGGTGRAIFLGGGSLSNCCTPITNTTFKSVTVPCGTNGTRRCKEVTTTVAYQRKPNCDGPACPASSSWSSLKGCSPCSEQDAVIAGTFV